MTGRKETVLDPRRLTVEALLLVASRQQQEHRSGSNHGGH